MKLQRPSWIDESLTPLPAGRIRRLLDKPRSQWTAHDMVRLVQDHGVRTIALMHVGSDGWLKTLDFVPLDQEHLRDILAGGERADGSSLFADTGIQAGASDIVLRPRIASAFFDPFSPYPCLAFLCEHYGRDGRPLPQSPDTVVRRAFQCLYDETGVELLALGEVEYFLGKRAEEEDVYGSHDRGYHATSPFVFGEGLRREAMAILGEIGVHVKYGHSEVGYIEASEADGHIWEQHEIELALRPLPDAAEAVVLTQWVLRNLAHAHGLRCSFDPILRAGHAGSGMHFHLSPTRDGIHLGGVGKDGDLAEEARWLIGGLVTLGGALMAFGNRSEESFVRLSQGKEAPRAITWGRFNRHALVRLPIQAVSEDGRVVTPPTIEFRLPDGSVQPYLLLAGMAQAMLHGRSLQNLDEVLVSTDASRRRDEGTGAGVPRTAAEVAEALQRHAAALNAGGVFAEGMIDAMTAHLRAQEA
jgi:glutamine synthetase